MPCRLSQCYNNKLRGWFTSNGEVLYQDYSWKLGERIAASPRVVQRTVQMRAQFCGNFIALVLNDASTVQDVFRDWDENLSSREFVQRALGNLAEDLHIEKTERRICDSDRGADQLAMRRLVRRMGALKIAEMMLKDIQSFESRLYAFRTMTAGIIGYDAFELLRALDCSAEDLMAVSDHLEEIHG